MHYVYVLKSLKDKKLYIGCTKDLKKRLSLHNKEQVLATRSRKPLTVIFYEAFNNHRDARRQELFYKSGYGREVLKGKLKNSFQSNDIFKNKKEK